MKAFDRGQKNQKTSGGFTLVELMIVIVIMVILAAAAVPLFGGYAQRAKDSKSIAECRQVVQAAQVKANDLYAAGLLEIDRDLDESSCTAVLKLANVDGEIIAGPFVKTDSQVTYLLYECKNGAVVRYDITKNPVYAVEAGEGPVTVVEDWVKRAEDWKNDYLSSSEKPNLSPGREEIIKRAEKAGLLKVNDYYTKGTAFEGGDTLYWRPYYIGKIDSGQTILYANKNATGTGGWTASLVYVDGDVYVNVGPNTNISQIYNGNNTYEEVKTWLQRPDSGYKLKK